MPPINPSVKTEPKTITKPVVQKPVSADNDESKFDTTKSTVIPVDTASVIPADTTSVTTTTVPSVTTSATSSATTDNATKESDKKNIPVLPIAATAFTAIAAAGIIIAYKKKENEGEKEPK